ncbi:MAG: shikimate dehydrogenase [Firmicutes bacterium]|nr:shikimate dehydrogenase [Bacillota bacterium]
MKKFAFIFHPLDLGYIHRQFPWTRVLPDSALKAALRALPPGVISRITGIGSARAEAEGWFINVPLTADQMLSLPEEIVIKKIVRAGRLAEQLGAQVLGLGAFTAIVGDAGTEVAKQLHIPVTTGNSYTVGMALAGIRLAAKKMCIDLKKAEVLVVGANGAIGSACSRILAREVNYLTVASRNDRRLEGLARRILRESGLAVRIAADLKSALTQADIVISVTGSATPVIEPQDLKPGAVVCDVARPRDVSQEVAKARPDVLVIEGGVVRVPGAVDFGFDFGFPPGTSYACMAETMILALEGRQDSFTLGRNLSVEQIDEIMQLGNKHGFELAGLRSFDRAVRENEIKAIRKQAEFSGSSRRFS